MLKNIDSAQFLLFFPVICLETGGGFMSTVCEALIQSAAGKEAFQVTCCVLFRCVAFQISST